MDYREGEPFRSDKGYATGLIYGFLSMLSDWLPSIDRPTRALLFFDGSPKRRRVVDPTYKVKDPQAFPSPGSDYRPIQLTDGFKAEGECDVISHILGLFGIDTIYDRDEEADDLIASYVYQHPKDIHIIISSDKDFFQIVSDSVILYRPGVEGDRFFDAARTEEYMYKRYKVHVAPNGVRMFKSLTGDPSDGIVGVPRLRKRVIAPLCSLPTVEAVYATGLPGFSKLEKEHTLALRERVNLNFELVGLFKALNLEPMRTHLEPDHELAVQILREDLQIHGVDVRALRFGSVGKSRYSDAVVTTAPVSGLMPDNFLDDL